MNNKSKRIMKTLTITELILLLKSEAMKGGKTVQINGTILCPENGNSIIISTQKQF